MGILTMSCWIVARKPAEKTCRKEHKEKGVPSDPLGDEACPVDDGGNGMVCWLVPVFAAVAFFVVKWAAFSWLRMGKMPLLRLQVCGFTGVFDVRGRDAGEFRPPFLLPAAKDMKCPIKSNSVGHGLSD
jgi:hypothetical protein